MDAHSISDKSHQSDRFSLSGRNKHVEKFLSKYVALFLIVGVDQPWF